MSLNLTELIEALAGLMSVSGYETHDAEALSALLGDIFDEDITDLVGNRILVRRCGRANAPAILIDTHFDEIGFYVSELLEDGFLRVEPVGGLDARTLPAAAVRIYGAQVLDGVIGSTPPHLRSQDEGDEVEPPREVLVDTGYRREVLEQIVRIGTPIGFAPHYSRLENRRLVGKGFDNKACAAAAIFALAELDRKALAGDVYLCLSVHEETARVGGAAVGGYAVEPDYAMVVDVNIGLAPGTKKTEGVALGAGPSLSRSAIIDRRLTKMTEALCDRAGIPWQRSVDPVSTGTNTGALHLVKNGIPVVDVGLPLRAMHTYVEMLDMADAENLVALIRAFVCDSEIAKEFGYEAGN